MRTIAIIQARLGSSRLPAKLALDLCGATLLQRVVERAALAAGVDEIIVATSDRPQDDVTETIGRRVGVPVFRGSLDDARDRFLRAARWRGADVLLRLTADNPFVEPAYMEELLLKKAAHPDCPYIVHDLSKVVLGTASELVDVEALERASRDMTGPSEAEHVTPALRSRVDAVALAPPPELSDADLSLSVDTPEDYVSSFRLYEEFGGGRAALARIVAAFRKDDGRSARFRRRTDHGGG